MFIHIMCMRSIHKSEVLYRCEEHSTRKLLPYQWYYFSFDGLQSIEKFFRDRGLIGFTTNLRIHLTFNQDYTNYNEIERISLAQIDIECLLQWQNIS